MKLLLPFPVGIDNERPLSGLFIMLPQLVTAD